MSRLAKRPLINHASVAAIARQMPGQWHLVGEYRSSMSAEAAVYEIETGGISSKKANKRRTPSPYAPAGAFEARKQLTEFGCKVHVRYVGGGAR